MTTRITPFALVIVLFVLCWALPGCGSGSDSSTSQVNPVPTITALSTDNVLLNSQDLTLKITGSNFVTGAMVSFGIVQLKPSLLGSAELSVLVPKSQFVTAGIVEVKVSNPSPGGGASNALNFTVNNPVPVLTALSVDTAQALADADLPFEVSGSNFAAGATVDFGPTKLTPGSPKGNKLGVTIPVAALQTGGYIPVTVTNPGPGGGPSNALMFRLNNPSPELNSLSQALALAGDPPFDLTLTGAKFVSTTLIDFGGAVLTPSSVTRSQMVVSVPESAFATGGVIQVKAVSPEPGGGSSRTIDFTINNPVPAITSSDPTSITNTGRDAVISLIGTGFVSTSAVTLGTDPASSSLVSKNNLQVTVPTASVAAAVTTGKISLSVANPSPAGGTSNTFDVNVRDMADLTWQTIANGSTAMPGTKTTTLFNLFGPVSINAAGLAAFNGQSAVTTSDSEETTSTKGLYTVDLATGTVSRIADTSTLVPDPNTITYGLTLAKFGGFPSFARIDQNSSVVGFVGTHPPVLQLLNDGRVGSSGLYANPSTVLDTGVGLFTQDPYTYFQIPDLPATAFGAFPNAPAIVGGNTIVFKGDYLSGTTVATGVYYRDLVADSGESPVTLLASVNSTQIPEKTLKFGYFGAPSAVGTTAVFVGYDQKDAPTAGGIYSASISSAPALNPLVTIGTLVPGETETDTFTRFGEALSFDGRYVGFWGAWGTDISKIHVTCSEQDAAVQAYCLTVFPDGYDAQVPVHQGMFVYDITSSTLTTVAKAGTDFTDFTYWPFVGTLPEEGAPTDVGSSGGGGDETEVEVPLEPPAFVLSTSIVVAGQSSTAYQVAFKAKTGSVDGIYITSGPETALILTALDTTMIGTTVDGASNATSTIKKLDLEREGLRGTRLAIGASMHDSATSTDAAGLYTTTISTQ